MLSLILGLTAFVLYLLYDINSFSRKYRFVHSFFMLGTLLLGIATALDLTAAWKSGCIAGILDLILLTAAAIFFGALIYCLFFALPFEQTYADQTTGRHVYTCGAYALCRHPGILCFFGMYLLLGLAALPGNMLRHSLLFSLLNLAYAWFQDRITFPKTFCDYSEYQKNVPFLIPTGSSIRRAGKTLHPSTKEEDEL